MRVVICDVHRVFADVLTSLLRSAGHDVVGSAAELDMAAGIACAEEADACVLDPRLPWQGDVRELEQAVASAPGTAFVVLAGSADPVSLGRVAAAGVRGIALKSDDFAEILRVLTMAVTGRAARSMTARSPALSMSAQAVLRPGYRQYHQRARLLTRRELEALAHLVRGESTAGIAKLMGVRISTARTHVDAVLTKLGAHSRLEAVAYAVREGLVDVGTGDDSARAASG